MKSNLGNRNYVKIRKFFLLEPIENTFFTCLYLRNGRSPDLQTWNFLAKKTFDVYSDVLYKTLKSHGLTSFPFHENWKRWKKISVKAIHCTHIVFWISLQRKEIEPSNFQSDFWWEISSGLILCKSPMNTCGCRGSSFIATWRNSVICKLFPSRLTIYYKFFEQI